MQEHKLTREGLLNSYNKLEDRNESIISYVFLTISAAIICAFGFRMNSASVIVGAMVISPLLFVVVGISAALFRKKWKLLRDNIVTLLIGIVIAIIVSFLVNIILPTIKDSEILTRIISSKTDYFMVAFFSGLAGTFAFFWPEIIEAIAGIAISVALIPPVVMVGIGLAKLDVSFINTSLEIIFINILGILIGSFLTILILHLYTRKTKVMT